MSNCLKKFIIYYVILLANFFVLFCTRGELHLVLSNANLFNQVSIMSRGV